MLSNLHFHLGTKISIYSPVSRVRSDVRPGSPDLITWSCGIGDDRRPLVIFPWYKVRTSTSFNFTFLYIWADTSPDSSPESNIALWNFIVVFDSLNFTFFYFWFCYCRISLFIPKETCPRFLNIESSNDENDSFLMKSMTHRSMPINSPNYSDGSITTRDASSLPFISKSHQRLTFYF